MKPFEIYYWQPPGWNEPHPCVIVSHRDRVNRKDAIEVVMCSTKRATRAPESHEMMLDNADGLDWPTICKCDLIYAVEKAALKSRKGEVVPGRQGKLVRTLIEAHGWPAVL